MLEQTYPLDKKLALGIQGIAAVLLKDQLAADTVDGYEPCSTFDRERLHLALSELSGRLVVLSEPRSF